MGGALTGVPSAVVPEAAMVIVSVWDRALPGATAALATATTVSGVLVASVSQRHSAGKASDLSAGIAVATLARSVCSGQ